jgi:hypothetical protein
MNDRPKSLNVAALGVQVESLETDVRDLKDSVVGLDAKIDKAVSSLAHEVRTLVAGLSAQLNDRQRTPWVAIFAGASLAVSVLMLFGSQALSPIQSDIKQLKSDIVPRVELEHRFGAVETTVERIRQERYDEQRDRIVYLRDQLQRERLRNKPQ